LLCNREFSEVELYNLDIDPVERWNFARGHPDIAERLVVRLRAIYEEVNKPYPENRYLNRHILELKRIQDSAVK